MDTQSHIYGVRTGQVADGTFCPLGNKRQYSITKHVYSLSFAHIRTFKVSDTCVGREKVKQDIEAGSDGRFCTPNKLANDMASINM